MPIEFRLLGSVEAYGEGDESPLMLGPLRQRSVLVSLLMDANNPVSLGDLVWRVWGADVPREPRSSLHSYFTRLRSVLAGKADIVRTGHGYALTVDRLTMDLHRFHRALSGARAARDAHEAVRHFDEALGLWRGEPFAGLDSPWLHDVRTTLEAERESALLDRVDHLLELGRHERLVPELTARADQNPLDERVAAQLMLAQYRSGAQASALLRFQKIKALLSDQLGVDPGLALRALHEAMLREEPVLNVPDQDRGHSVGAGARARPSGRTEGRHAAPPGQSVQAPLAPRQLPAAPHSFVGREAESDYLTTALLADGQATGSVLVISGIGGIGKSSLALHWAHRHSARFPDGQLFLDLCGFDSSAEPVSPHAAIRWLLLALAVDRHAVPDEPEALIGLYRSTVAKKRLMLVIDNVADAAQVIPLLPAAKQSATIVISRNRLSSLVASHDAALLTLDALPRADAQELLVSRLGAQRSGAEPDAVDRLRDACGGLPLALTITAGRAREHPEFALTALANELGDARSTLDMFDMDAAWGVRAVLSTSHVALTPEQARAFLMLGLAPGTEVGLEAAAALMGSTHAETGNVLRALERCSLVQQHRPGRFRMHDLVKAYAREQANEQLPDDARTEATYRITSFYLDRAMSCVPASGSIDPGWFEVEADNILATVKLAQGRFWHRIVSSFALALVSLVPRALTSTDIHRTLAEAGLTAAIACADKGKVTLFHHTLARLPARVGEGEEYLRRLKHSLRLAEQAGDALGAVFIHECIAEAHWRFGRFELAQGSSATACKLSSHLSTDIQARAAGFHAWILAMGGRYDTAGTFAERSLALPDPAADSHRYAALDTLGYVCRKTGRFKEAIDYLKESLSANVSDLLTRADTHWSLGSAYLALECADQARQHFDRALTYYEIQHRGDDVHRARAALNELQARQRIPVADRPAPRVICSARRAGV